MCNIQKKDEFYLIFFAHVFFIRSNSNAKDLSWRMWTKNHLDAKISQFPWNFEENTLTPVDVPVLATCHGTNWESAKKICHNGFATLCSFDKGFYGTGF